jgi:hypothetical protein
MPDTVSTIPACLDALVELGARALPDIQISYGQPFEVGADIVCFAFTGEPGEPAVQSTQTRDRATTDPSRESYDVVNTACSLRGDTELQPRGAAVFEFVDAVAAELAKDPTLGGVVARAELTVAAVALMQTDEGAAATVQFTIHIDAWTGP